MSATSTVSTRAAGELRPVGFVAVRRGVVAYHVEEMAALVWATEEEAQTWCDSRKGRHQGGWMPLPLIPAEVAA